MLVNRLAEYRQHVRLAERTQTIPDQVGKPTAYLTIQWVFQCLEGMELLHIPTSTTSFTRMLRLQTLYRLILELFESLYEKNYNPSG